MANFTVIGTPLCIHPYLCLCETPKWFFAYILECKIRVLSHTPQNCVYSSLMTYCTMGCPLYHHSLIDIYAHSKFQKINMENENCPTTASCRLLGRLVDTTSMGRQDTLSSCLCTFMRHRLHILLMLAYLSQSISGYSTVISYCVRLCWLCVLRKKCWLPRWRCSILPVRRTFCSYEVNRAHGGRPTIAAAAAMPSHTIIYGIKSCQYNYTKWLSNEESIHRASVQ